MKHIYAKSFRWNYIVILSIIFVSFGLIQLVSGERGAPGTDSDPIVTQSYVDQKIKELSTSVQDTSKTVSELSANLGEIRKKTDEVTSQALLIEQIRLLSERIIALEKSTKINSDGVPKFITINPSKGKTVFGKESTEMILRTGKAKIVSTTSIGIPDITKGIDLKSGESVPINNMLIVPKDDGRGIKILTSDAWVMIRGGYEVK